MSIFASIVGNESTLNEFMAKISFGSAQPLQALLSFLSASASWCAWPTSSPSETWRSSRGSPPSSPGPPS
eukprot:2441275-Lingulodinium_polyedra.AAC.1